MFVDRQNVSYLANGFAGHRGREVPAGRQSGLSVTNRKQEQKSQKRKRYQDRFFRFSFISRFLLGIFSSRPSSALSRLSRPAKYLGILQGANYCDEAR